jgi:2-alkyl-3-oxoalkanoate reductase
MRVLVLGATGAIGRHVVPLLLARGHQVTGAGRSPARVAALERAGARPITVDLLDPGQVHAAAERAVGWFTHRGAEVAP